MIDPATIDLSALPWLPLDAKAAFPRQPCIYFAIDSQGVVQYVGRAVDPKQRWASHHRFNDISALGGVRIAYLFMDADLLPSVEAALIVWFEPPLNAAFPKQEIEVSKDAKPVKRGFVVRAVKEWDVLSLPFKLKAAAAKSNKSTLRICREAYISPAFWYQVINGKKESITFDTLSRICTALNISLESIGLNPDN